jgi:hypothetical protein
MDCSDQTLYTSTHFIVLFFGMALRGALARTPTQTSTPINTIIMDMTIAKWAQQKQ